MSGWSAEMLLQWSLLVLFLVTPGLSLLGNPYHILQVDRNANLTDIKRAYKLLVRKWHPDKNPSGDALERMVELNKAYELLRDPIRRDDFDLHGITEDTPNFRRRPDPFQRFDFESSRRRRMFDEISIGTREVLTLLSVMASVGFIVLIGFIMQHLVKLEEKSIQEKYRQMGRPPPGARHSRTDCRLSIHELRGETYNGLVRLLKPGCRTVVLLCDQASKPKLLPVFYRCVYPYRKNKTLMWAYLLVEKNVEWYKRLLLQTLVDYQDLHINPKNCIGTVLALNGFRKYFCIYHAKHPERRPREADFLGLEEGEDPELGGCLVKRSEAEEEEDVLFEEHLLDGLGEWLERLFRGGTQKYHISFWSEHMK